MVFFEKTKFFFIRDRVIGSSLFEIIPILIRLVRRLLFEKSECD